MPSSIGHWPPTRWQGLEAVSDEAFRVAGCWKADLLENAHKMRDLPSLT
jgi:hypothetical protein